MTDIKVGDRIRAERKDVTVEGVVSHVDDYGIDVGSVVAVSDDDWTITVLERAPIPEPKGLGAVVEFDHRHVGHVRAVRNENLAPAQGSWRDADGGWWTWSAISRDGMNIEILSEGVDVT